MGLYKRKESRYWWMSHFIRGRQVVRSTGKIDRDEAQSVLNEFCRSNKLPNIDRPRSFQPKAVTVPKPEPGVYCLKSAATGLIKIGHSANMSARIRTLNSSSPEEWTVLVKMRCKNHDMVETILHARFKNQWVRGEWFRISEAELLEAMRGWGD